MVDFDAIARDRAAEDDRAWFLSREPRCSERTARAFVARMQRLCPPAERGQQAEATLQALRLRARAETMISED